MSLWRSKYDRLLFPSIDTNTMKSIGKDDLLASSVPEV